MRRALTILILILILIISSLSISAKLADSPCPTYRGNMKRTCLYPYTTDIEIPNVKWKFYCEDGVESAPVIDSDGTIYTGTYTDNFFAINPDGTEKWRYTREGVHFSSTPTIDANGTIYTIGCVITDDTIYNPSLNSSDFFGYPILIALNSDGTLKWEFNAGGLSSGILYSPGIASDGTIYMITGSSQMPGAVGGDGFYAIKPDGTEKWFYETGSEQYSASAIADDGTIYFGCTNGYFYALNPNGDLKWKFVNDDGDLLDNCFNAVPSIGPDGTIYAGSKDQNLYALNPEDGSMKWKFSMDSTVEATPSIGFDGTIYAGGYAPSEEKYLYALNPEDGSLKWKFETGSGVYGTPAIDANGILYFGSYDKNFYSLDPDGTERWRIETDGGICMSPTIDEDGTIYFGGWDNYLYAIDGNAEGEISDNILYAGEEKQNEETPGFEIIVLTIAILLILFFKKKYY